MNAAADIEERIRLLSDGALYDKAVGFARTYSWVGTAQLHGLLQYAQSRHDLTRFVDHQRQRDWAQSRETGGYKEFYDDLHQALQEIDREAAEFLPTGLSRREQRARASLYEGLLAYEFVQHLVAEAEFARVMG